MAAADPSPAQQPRQNVVAVPSTELEPEPEPEPAVGAEAAVNEDSIVAMDPREAFQRIDTNGDGRISRAEAIKRLRNDPKLADMLGIGCKITDAQREAFEDKWREIDTDADDCITLDEFVRFWMQQQEVPSVSDGTSQTNTPSRADPPAAAQPMSPRAPASVASAPSQGSRQQAAAAAAAAAPGQWQDSPKLVVLCELAQEMSTLGQTEPATAIAFRIIELLNTASTFRPPLPQQQAQREDTQVQLALVLVSALAKTFAENGQYEAAAALAQRVLKLDRLNVEASGVVRFVRDQARDWSESSGSHLPGVRVGREHADRAAYAIQNPVRSQHGPRPRQPTTASLNPRPGHGGQQRQRPKTGRTIYVLPPRLSSSSGSGRDKAPGLVARPPSRAATGRPVPTDTEAGGVTPAGLRSQQLARQYDMVPVSVLLRESTSPKHVTSWVVMDEAAIPMGAEKAQIMLEQAYDVKRQGEQLKDETTQLRRQTAEDQKRIQLLEQILKRAQDREKAAAQMPGRGGGGGGGGGSDAAVAGFVRLLDEMNDSSADGIIHTKPESDDWELPAARSYMLQQLCDKQDAEQAAAQANGGGYGDDEAVAGHDVVQRAQAFRVVFKALDVSGLGKIVKSDLVNALKKDVNIARLLALPCEPGEEPFDAEAHGSGGGSSPLAFEHELEKMGIGDGEEIHEAKFVAMSTAGLFASKARLVMGRSRALKEMSHRVHDAESRAAKESEEADAADVLAAKEAEEARRAEMLAEKEETEAMLAERAAAKEADEAEEAAADAMREEAEAEAAEALAAEEEREAREAQEAAAKEQEEAKLAMEKAAAEEADVIEARKAKVNAEATLEALQLSNPEDSAAIEAAEAAVAKAEADLQREEAEHREAVEVAERETAEAREATALAAKEMREAAEARGQAEVERQEAAAAAARALAEKKEAEEARETADRERQEAREAKMLAEKEAIEARDAMALAKRERAEADEARQHADQVREEAEQLKVALAEAQVNQQRESAQREHDYKLLQGEMDKNREQLEAERRQFEDRRKSNKTPYWDDDDDDDEDEADLALLAGVPAAPAPAVGRLVVTIERCTNVIVADKSGTSDPYCLVGVGVSSLFDTLHIPKKQHKDELFPKKGHWLRTDKVERNLNPVFNESFTIAMPAQQQQQHLAGGGGGVDPVLLKIQLFDWDRIGTNDFLGECTVDLAKVMGGGGGGGGGGWEEGFERTLTKGFSDYGGKVPAEHVKKRIDAAVMQCVALRCAALPSVWHCAALCCALLCCAVLCCAVRVLCCARASLCW